MWLSLRRAVSVALPPSYDGSGLRVRFTLRSKHTWPLHCISDFEKRKERQANKSTNNKSISQSNTLPLTPYNFEPQVKNKIHGLSPQRKIAVAAQSQLQYQADFHDKPVTIYKNNHSESRANNLHVHTFEMLQMAAYKMIIKLYDMLKDRCRPQQMV